MQANNLQAKEKIRIPSATKPKALIQKKFSEILIESPKWKAHLGNPEKPKPATKTKNNPNVKITKTGWFVFGDSGHGKTTYMLMMAKELAKKYKVHYNTLEEGDKKSFQTALIRAGLNDSKNFQFAQENLEELSTRLRQKKQPKIVFIDSVQYFFRGKQFSQYEKFIEEFNDTLFIWVSGAVGKIPKGKLADDIRYDCDIVNYIKDFRAEIRKNRFEATAPFVIWEEGYNQRMLEL
ncbi:P-loop NTPase family protein [Flavobacterium covae]|uniref:AAA family ATPase n=1 Tax=Flavobacterium covae TaxID=2906076 RepID=UPI000745B74F|nr:AAA family ATPase [Flavobacterium covae]AMA49436.1 hypothetical protein AWN65_08185 [Flavobacterium covae]MCJ1808957.1 AAA family ATPase [Flavobacterium covae]